MANASLPRAINESAMTTIGNKMSSRTNKNVDRKKNSTPHSFVGPSPSLDGFTNNKVTIQHNISTTIDDMNIKNMK